MSRGRAIQNAVEPFFTRIGLRKRQSFGLNGLDHELYRYINFRNGVFIEAGGNDGVSQSNSLFFEKYLGWTGLLVEPIPELAERCRRNRPRSKVAQCALVPSDYGSAEAKIHYCNLMSIVHGSRSDAEIAHHLEVGSQFLAEGDPIRLLSVPAKPLSALIDEAGLDRIDLLSLDVEGFEIEVLKGLDVKRHAPGWMLVEGAPERVLDFLGDKYALVASLSQGDHLFRLKDTKALK